MKISLEHISKKFQRHWIFRDVTVSFSAPGGYAILGANGSGKSTFLRVIAGIQSASSGSITYQNADGQMVDGADFYRSLSFCAPAMEVIEEFTLREFLTFHFSFKKSVSISDNRPATVEEIIATIGLQESADKPVNDFSSGMKQRVKLAQSIFADTPVLLLDEPCTNLDAAGVNQYQEWIRLYQRNRLVIVASNDPREYGFCRETIDISHFR